MICSESREKVKESLKKWRYALKRRGVKVNKARQNMCMSERETDVAVKLKGKQVVRVSVFKYLEFTT